MAYELQRRRLLKALAAGAAVTGVVTTARAQAAPGPTGALELIDVTKPPYNVVPNAASADAVKATQAAILAAANDAGDRIVGGRNAGIYLPGMAQETHADPRQNRYNAYVAEQLSLPDRVRLFGDGLNTRLRQADGVNDSFLVLGQPGAHLSWFDLFDLVIDGNWARNTLPAGAALVRTNAVRQFIANVVVCDAGGVAVDLGYDGGDIGRILPIGGGSKVENLVVVNALKEALIFNGPSDTVISASEFINASQEGYAESDAAPGAPFYEGGYAAMFMRSAAKLSDVHVHMGAYAVHPDGQLRVARRPRYALTVDKGVVLNVANSHFEGAMTQFYAPPEAPGSMFTATRFYNSAGGPAVALDSGYHSFAACHIAGPMPQATPPDGAAREAGLSLPQEIVGLRIGREGVVVDGIEFDGQVHACRGGGVDLTWSGRDCWLDVSLYDCGPGFIGTPARDSAVVGWPATPVRGLTATGSSRADALGGLPPNRDLYVIEAGGEGAGIALPDRNGATSQPLIRNASDSAKHIYPSADTTAAANKTDATAPLITLAPGETCMAWTLPGNDGQVYWDAVLI